MLIRKLIKKVQLLSPKAFLIQNRYFYEGDMPKFDHKKDYYSILQVEESATELDIKKSYYRLAKQYHPDNNKGNENRFKDISEAYSILNDSQVRKAYNQSRYFESIYQAKKKSDAQKHFKKYGTYNQESAQNPFAKPSQSELTPQELEAFKKTKKLIKRLLIFGLGFSLFIPFISRQGTPRYFDQNGKISVQGGGLDDRVYPMRRGKSSDRYAQPVGRQQQQNNQYQNQQQYNPNYNQQYNPNYNQQYNPNYGNPPQYKQQPIPTGMQVTGVFQQD